MEFVVVPGIMLIQHKRFRKMFLGGLGLNLLAVGLMVLTPGLKAIHLATCPYHHHGSVHCYDQHSTCHCTHHSNKKKSLLDTVGEQNHAGGVCPICRSLGAVGKHVLSSDNVCLVSNGPMEESGAVFAFIGHSPLYFLNHSISPRAPPVRS